MGRVEVLVVEESLLDLVGVSLRGLRVALGMVPHGFLNNNIFNSFSKNV